MRVLFFCPLWGCEKKPFEEFVRNVKGAGYDGAEMGFPSDPDKKLVYLKILRDEGLLLIAQHSKTHDADFKTHKSQYEKRLNNLVDTNPLFINSQTGKDFFSFEQNSELITLAQTFSQKTGIKLLHETHRGRFNFAAHITRQYLNHFENLHLSLDISHWCNVAESMLQDQEEAVSLALSQTGHIHARVGFSEGPQIPDPRAPEWQDTLEQHLVWWDTVVEAFKRRSEDSVTITAEFGPFPYMQIHPETKMPLADQWELNLYMKDLLLSRYGQ